MKTINSNELETETNRHYVSNYIFVENKVLSFQKGQEKLQKTSVPKQYLKVIETFEGRSNCRS